MRKCSECDGEAVKGKKLCADCRARKDAEEQRREANIRWWRTSAGQKKEAPVQQLYPRKETIFSSGAALLRTNECIGELLKTVIGICFKRPDYLRPASAARYIALLAEFGNSTLQSPWDRSFAGRCVADLSILHLGMALGDWVSCSLKEPIHPMMPNYVLDAARFIELHASGHDGRSRESWRLEPLVQAESQGRDLFGFLCKEFKKSFTESMPAVLCVGRVPPAARIRWHETLITEETSFLFGFQRCYLSENFNDYYSVQMSCHEPAAPAFDLMHEFRFTGEFQLVKDETGRHVTVPGEDPLAIANEFLHRHREGKAIQVGGRLPGDWITDVVRFERDSTVTLLPVPLWEAEFDR